MCIIKSGTQIPRTTLSTMRNFGTPLLDIDEVAYVRFASVYRQFKDIDTFMHELNKLLNEK